MRIAIDQDGHIVIPQVLRNAVGLLAGEVEVTVDGAGLRVEPVPGTGLVERRGRLVIEPGVPFTDEDVLGLRLADQR